MKMSKYYQSPYLSAQDVPTQFVGTIDKVEEAELRGETKPVLYFKENRKGLILNKINAKVLMNAYGDETVAWHGEKVVCYTTKVEFRGNMVDSLRLKIMPPEDPRGMAPEEVPY